MKQNNSSKDTYENSFIKLKINEIVNLSKELNGDGSNNLYQKPKLKRLVKKKATKKIFMGCWQGCNEDNDGDGC